MLPQELHICSFEVVDGKLKFFLVADIAIVNWLAAVRVTRPDDVINAVYVLKKSADALQPICEFGRDGIEVHAAALLEVGELRDLQAVKHHLPANAPRAQRRRLPIVFLKL